MNEPMQAPRTRIRVGRYTFASHTWFGEWTVSNGCRGASGPDPVSAFVALKRWEKEPSRPE